MSPRTRYGITRSTLFGLATVVVCSVSTMTLARGKAATRSVPPDVQQQAQRAYVRDGLAGAAKVTGSYVRDAAPEFLGSPLSLAALTEFSESVVIGTVESNSGFLTERGRSISTLFRFRVHEVLKGPTVDVTSIVLRGGRVGFPDGSWAQVNSKGIMPFQPGRLYLVLLRPALKHLAQDGAGHSGGAKLMEPALGGLGIYDISALDEMVRPAGGTDTTFGGDLVRRMLTVREFVQLIRSEVGRGR